MLKIGEAISEGWRIVKENFGSVWLGTFILLLINSALSVLYGAVIAGNAYGTFKAMKREPVELGDMLSHGFARPLEYILGGLLIAILTALSLCLCIIPVFFVAPMLWYAIPAIVDRGCGFGEAMGISRRLWGKAVGAHVLFVFAVIGVNILGCLACGIGVFVTAVITQCAIAVAYKQLSADEAPATAPATA